MHFFGYATTLCALLCMRGHAEKNRLEIEHEPRSSVKDIQKASGCVFDGPCGEAGHTHWGARSSSQVR